LNFFLLASDIKIIILLLCNASGHTISYEKTETANGLTEKHKLNHGEPIVGTYLKLVQMSKESIEGEKETVNRAVQIPF